MPGHVNATKSRTACKLEPMNVLLDEDMIEISVTLGEGNRSQGVRKILSVLITAYADNEDILDPILEQVDAMRDLLQNPQRRPFFRRVTIWLPSSMIREVRRMKRDGRICDGEFVRACIAFAQHTL